MHGQYDNNRTSLLDNSICSTLSTVCFVPCSKLVTIYKDCNWFDYKLTFAKLFFSFLHHVCYLERGMEKRCFTSRFIQDWWREFYYLHKYSFCSGPLPADVFGGGKMIVIW